MKDTVLVSMGVLALLVALNDGWIYYLKGFVQASVGTGGAPSVTNLAPNVVPPTSPSWQQSGTLVNSPRPTSIGNQRLP